MVQQKGVLGEAATAASPQTTSRANRYAQFVPFLFLIPTIGLLLVLVVPVFVFLIKESLIQGNPLLGINVQFVGLDNFISLLTSGSYWVIWLRTLGFVVVALGLEIGLGVCLAMLMSRRRWGNVLSIVVMLPLATEPAITALVWQSWFNPAYGIVDFYLMKAHVINAAIPWLSQTNTTFIVLILLNMWQWTPFVAIIILGGLKSVSAELYQSAAVDGASAWQTFWHITLPSIWPFLSVAVLLRLIDLFKTYASINTLTGGGPGQSTVLMSLAIYRNTLQYYQVGLGSAEGLLMLIIVSILVSATFKLLGIRRGGRPFDL